MIARLKTSINHYISSPTLTALSISLLFAFVYFLTAPRTNVSYADSDLMIVIGHYLGLAAPPGYQLYVLLTHIFTHLHIPGSIAFRAHLLSLTLHTATLFVIALTIYHLVDHYQSTTRDKIKPLTTYLITLVSTSLLGSAFLFWLYSIVAEKYPLNNLLISLTLYFTLQLSIQKPSSHRPLWLGLAATLGLGIFAHQTFLLILPTVVLLIYYQLPSFKRHLLLYFCTSVLFILLSLSLLFFLNSRDVPVTWQFSPTFQGLTDELTRKDFQGILITTGKVRGSLYLQPTNPAQIIGQIPHWLGFMIGNFGFLGIGLFLIGLYTAPKHDPVIGRYLILAALTTTIFLPLYAIWPGDLANQAIRQRWLLAGLIPAPLLIATGLYRLQYYLNATKSQLKPLTLLAAALAIPVYNFATTYPDLNLRHFDLVHNFYQAILKDLPQDSVLVCLSDVSCFALLYSHYVEGIRPDVTLVNHGLHLVNHASFPDDLGGFDYSGLPERIIDIITWNLDTRPVFVVDLQQIYHDHLGINYGFLHYIPHGYYGQIVSSPPATLPTPDYHLDLDHYRFPARDPMRRQFLASLIQKHFLNAISYARLERSDLVQTELTQAATLTPSLPSLYQHELDRVKTQTSTLGYDRYVPGIKIPNLDTILTQADQYLLESRADLTYLGYLGVLNQDPLNQQARLKLAKLYQSAGDTARADQEYQNLLRYCDKDCNF